MNDCKKTKRKLFNIFEKDKICSSLNEIPDNDVNTPKFNLKLTARRRSTRLKTEIFVECIPPNSPEDDPYAFTQNEFKDTKLVYTPPKKKAKISKSPSFMERIDRYFNIQPSNAPSTLSANISQTTLDAAEEEDQKIGKALNSPNLKEDDDLQYYNDSFIDSIDTNAIVDMLNNTEIAENQSQVMNENSKNIATPKKYDRNSNENLKPIVRLNSKERAVSIKENNLQKGKAKSDISKRNQNVVDSIHTNTTIDMVSNSEIVEEKSQLPNEISNCNTTPKTHHTLKKRNTKPKENVETIVSLKTSKDQVSYKANKNLLKIKTKLKTTKKNQNDENCSHTLQSLRTRGRKGKFGNCQPESGISVGSENNDALNTTNIFSTQKKLQESLITETFAPQTSSLEKSVENKISVSLGKRERRQTICSIQMDNNDTKANSSQQLSVSLTSSPQKTIENEKSVSLQKRGRRPTISGIKRDNNIAEAKENHDSCKFSATSVISSRQKSQENERSVSLRKRGRQPTISGVQMYNNVAEISETHDSYQFPTASLISSRQKSLENEKSVPLQKRGRRPTISGIKMDNNAAEIKENHDSSQLHSVSLTLSPQKTVKNEISVPIRKRGRRQTICGIQMDNNVVEITETNDSNLLPSASMIPNPQQAVENKRSMSLRKRDRRPTISSIQMGSNVNEVTETNDNSQLLRKKGRRPSICQTKLENYFTRKANKSDESSLGNQTEITPDVNVTKITTKNLNGKCISKLNDNINSMTNNASNEQNTRRLPDSHKEKLSTVSQQVKDQSIKQQKIRSTGLNDNNVVEEPKRKRGRPRLSKSPNVAVAKQVKMRIQKVNVAKKPKNTYGKLSKDKLNSVNVRKIPKDRLDEVLDMLQNEDHEIWKDRNISCNAGIHRYWETRTMTSDQNMKMKYARQFLLRRDWLNLSKILCLSNQDAKNNIYYPLLVKYATLCLAHTDKEQFHKFVNSLITMADSSAIIKKCTKISRQNEE